MSKDKQMNEKELELISRSLDEDLSELERRRLSQKILSRDSGAQAWKRYHAVSAVIRKQFPACLDRDFSQRVMQAIENDAPHQDEAPTATGMHRVTSTFRHVAGLAIAASVATVSVISYQYFNQPSSSPGPLITSEVDSTNLVQPSTTNALQTLPVEFSPAGLSPPTQESVVSSQVEEKIYYQELNSYIQDHAGYGSQRIMTPYVEIIELKDMQD